MPNAFDLQQPQRLRKAISSTAVREISEKAGNARAERDPLYLFACHLEWRQMGSIAAYQELVAPLDDPNSGIRAVAEDLLHRSSPRPQRPVCNEVETW